LRKKSAKEHTNDSTAEGAGKHDTGNDQGVHECPFNGRERRRFSAPAAER